MPDETNRHDEHDHDGHEQHGQDGHGQDRKAENKQPPEQKELPTAKTGPLLIALLVIAILLGTTLVIGTATRVLAARNLHQEAVANAVPTVQVVHPTPVHGDTLVLPARIDAWSEAPVYARTSGYLHAWYSDIGAEVKNGQVLADIDTPDLDQQLAAARAALATSDANLNLAAITNTRWQKLLTQNAVSKQDADQRQGSYQANVAMRNEAQANVNRLLALEGFKKIVAPFDGVVTARNTDIGDLIVAGVPSSTPIFTVADTTRLRIYVQVPQAYVGAITQGLQAHFTVPEHPGEVYYATVSRSSGAVDAQSGAMLVQLVYDNHAKQLKPGGYAEVTFDLPAESKGNAVRIPDSAMLFRKEGTTIAVASDDGKIQIRKISILLDYGSELQIAGGVRTDEWVVDNPPDDIDNGDQVHVKQPCSKPGGDAQGPGGNSQNGGGGQGNASPAGNGQDNGKQAGNDQSCSNNQAGSNQQGGNQQSGKQDGAK